jgi:6-phosphogluconate dehydrogenase (decarboxylating)
VTTSNRMRLGMVGLGRMGPNIVRRLMRDSRNCVVFDVDPEAVKPPESGEGGWTSIASIDEGVPAPVLNSRASPWQGARKCSGPSRNPSRREMASPIDSPGRRR